MKKAIGIAAAALLAVGCSSSSSSSSSSAGSTSGGTTGHGSSGSSTGASSTGNTNSGNSTGTNAAGSSGGTNAGSSGGSGSTANGTLTGPLGFPVGNGAVFLQEEFDDGGVYGNEIEIDITSDTTDSCDIQFGGFPDGGAPPTPSRYLEVLVHDDGADGVQTDTPYNSETWAQHEIAVADAGGLPSAYAIVLDLDTSGSQFAIANRGVGGTVTVSNEGIVSLAFDVQMGSQASDADAGELVATDIETQCSYAIPAQQ